MTNPAVESDPDAQTLVVVVNDPADLTRARDERWYRIPVSRAPGRIGAEYLAFYQTGAFPPDEHWQVRWLAPVRGYYLAQRQELIPEEPNHPRAGDLYYKVTLGPLASLPAPIPSRRLRRITFIHTTLGRLLEAKEINDLWIKSRAHERLWEALRQADLEAEYSFPIADDPEGPAVDFALPCRAGMVAVVVDNEARADGEIREETTGFPEYLLTGLGWQIVRIAAAEIETGAPAWAFRLAGLCANLGGVT